MRNRYFQLLLLGIMFAFVRCATFDSVTLYKTTERISIHKIGFVDFSTDDNQNSEMYIKSQKIYRINVPSSLKQYGFDSAIYINSIINCYLPDTNEIIKICKNNKVDGILISTFKFVNSQDPAWSVSDIPGNLCTDLDVEMKLYDANGHLLITTFMEATLKSYIKELPTFETSAMDGTRGTVKLMAKEIKSLQIKKR